MVFDTEQFIKEIELRNAIWDPSTEEYTDRECRRRLWDEITCAMFDEDMSDEERSDISTLLQQKWKNIRTSFTRELRRKAGKSGSAAGRKSPYIYFDNLRFLWRTVENRAHEHIDAGQEDDNEGNTLCRQSTTPPPHPQKMPRVDCSKDLDHILNRCAAMTDQCCRKRHLQENPKHDTDRLFIMSLVDDFRSIPEQKKLTAKMELIRVIKWAQKVQPPHVPSRRNSNSDHDYVRCTNRMVQRSTQNRSSEVKIRRNFTSSPSLLRQRVNSRLLVTETDESEESDVMEMFTTQEVQEDLDDYDT